MSLARQIFKVIALTPQGMSVHFVDAAYFVVGRSDEADVCVQAPSVSREHLAVFSRDGELYVQDLESTYGTLINSKKIEAKQARRCPQGKPIGLGSATIVLSIRMLTKVEAGQMESIGYPGFVNRLIKTEIARSGMEVLSSFVRSRQDETPRDRMSSLDREKVVEGQIRELYAAAKTAVNSMHQAAEKECGQMIEIANQLCRDLEEEAKKQGRELIEQSKIKAKEECEEIKSQAKVDAEAAAHEAGEQIRARYKEQGARILNESHLEAEEAYKHKLAQAEADAAAALHYMDEKRQAILKEVSEAERKKQELTTELENLTNKKGETERELFDSKAEVVRLEERLKTVKEECATDEAQVAQLKSAKDELYNELGKGEAQLAEFQTRQRELTEITANYQKIMAEIQAERDRLIFEAEREVARLTSGNADLAKELAEKQEHVDRLRAQEVELAPALAKMRQEWDERVERQKEVLALKAQIEAARQDLEMYGEQIKSVATELGEREAELKKLTSNYDKIANDIEAKRQDTIARAEKEVARITANNETLLREIQAKEENLKRLRAEESERLAATEKLKLKLEVMEQEYQTQAAERRSEAQRLFDQIAAHRREKESLTQEVAALGVKHQQLQIEVNGMDQTAAKARAEAAEIIREARLEAEKILEKEIAVKRLEANEQMEKLVREGEIEFYDQIKGKMVSMLLELDDALEVSLKGVAALTERDRFTLKLEANRIVKDVLAGKSLGHQNKAKQLLAFDPAQIQEARRGRMRLLVGTAALILTVLMITIYHRAIGGMKNRVLRSIASQSAQDDYVKSFQAKMRRLSEFHPNMTDDFKSDYTLNVVYTKDFLDSELDPGYHQKWVLAVNDFILKKLGLDEDSAVHFIATEAKLIDQLKVLRAEINGQFEKDSVARMRTTEQDSLTELKQDVGGDKNFKALWKFKAQFFQSNKIPAPSPTPSPAAATK